MSKRHVAPINGLIVTCLIMFVSLANTEEQVQHSKCSNDERFNVHRYSILDRHGDEIQLSEYRGYILVIVNVASFCDLTTQQYHGLFHLKKYFDFELRIIALPCNQFSLQEPLDDPKQIIKALRHVNPGHGFSPNFEIFQKVDVNGYDEIPLYTTLKEACPSVQDEFFSVSKLFYCPLKKEDIRWNFEKFLIDPEGFPYKRYLSTVDPVDMEADIETLIHGYAMLHEGATSATPNTTAHT